ncbi:HEAT repeat domain-containing protein [Methanosarcina sp. KYL-1]|uniref:HEAT repeat domain-containing protein n=1 Tax=Methanosarcina sp. KYL-1 TaxID=2602068 RepID=UPI002100B9AA|nr:HEAT repeat domain-containing protein [Methanosarcina sp. KYL-1]
MIDQEKIHQQCLSDDPQVRYGATSALGSAFSHVPDKEQAWKDLIQLTSDEYSSVRSGTASALGSAFPHVPDKEQAWKDLIQLTSDEYSFVRYGAASALGSAFPHVPDKEQAWNDLHKLTSDEYSSVRSGAASALGSAFAHVPDKEQAWNDLHKLTSDKDRIVRVNANHSLGKVSILKASQAKKDDDYKKELETAIEFFEKASHESLYVLSNPSQFCLPFYRSYYTIVFKKQETKEEVDKYLAEAKRVVKGSKSKGTLLKAVENLANALKEVQNLENLDLEAKKGELNYFRQYCDRAAELMIDSEKAAPHATEVLRKGLPIFDRKLKELLEEIQNKAKIVCKEAEGTATEKIACAVSREVQKWEIGSQEEMTQMIENLAYVLEEKISVQPKNQFILSKIEQMKSERNLVNQYEILAQIIPLIRNVEVVPADHVKEGFENLNKGIKDIKEDTTNIKVELDIMCQKLDNISFGVSKLKLNSYNVTSNLPEIKKELEKLNEVVNLNTFSIDKLNTSQAEKLNELKNDLIERLEEIKVIVTKLPNEIDTEITNLVSELKQSDLNKFLQGSSGIASIIGLIISLALL